MDKLYLNYSNYYSRTFSSENNIIFSELLFNCLQVIKEELLNGMKSSTNKIIALFNIIFIAFDLWLLLCNIILFGLWMVNLIKNYYLNKLIVILLPWSVITSEPNVTAKLKQIIIEHKCLNL